MVTNKNIFNQYAFYHRTVKSQSLVKVKQVYGGPKGPANFDSVDLFDELQKKSPLEYRP